MDAIAQVADASDKVAMRYFEAGAAYRIACVEYRTVGQNDAGREHYAVAVGMCTTVHTRGVVHYDATYHSTLYRRWVGANLRP